MIWHRQKNQRHKRRVIIVLSLAIVICLGVVGAAVFFRHSLKPVSRTPQAVEITIAPGSSVHEIASLLKKRGLVRQAWSVELYVQLKGAQQLLQAGTYNLSPSQSTSSIISHLTHGKVSLKLVVILPGQRLDQVRQSLIDQGFSEASVDAALEPTQYENLTIMSDKPKGANLEGYLYPESFEKSADTTATDIVRQSILQLDSRITHELRQGFAEQGLTVYRALTIASIVEKEVVTPDDRAQAAQVFIKRLREGMTLGSDVTAFYGSTLAGAGQSVTYDTPYNTRLHVGLPPTPISNVSEASLSAVAKPSQTDWLFFVAGDDGITYFSRNFEQHQQLVERHCKRLCQ